MASQSKYFRVSITNQCNLDCYFCHNEGNGKDCEKLLSVNDIAYICGIAVEQGFDKIKLTGGEPTIRDDLPLLIGELKKLNIKDLSMITNGTTLINKIDTLKEAGLERINVTLNTLNHNKFEKITRTSSLMLDKTVNGIDLALHRGFQNIKLNFVYTGMESDKDLNDLLKFTSDRNLILVILPLIEESKEQITLNQIYEKIKIIGIKEEKCCIDNEGIKKRLIELLSGAKVLLRAEELSDHKPYIFCEECNKKEMCKEGIFPLRLSATGELIPCLASNNNRVAIRAAIKARNDKEVVNAINMIRSKCQTVVTYP